MALITTTTGGLGYVQDAWDAMTYFAFRPELYYEQFVTVRPTRQVMPGAVVRLTKTGELSEATTELTEDEDVTPVTFGDEKLSVTLREYGNVLKDTAKIRATSYIPLNPVHANLLGFNAGVSIDSIVRDVLHGGTNVRYGGDATARAEVDPDDTFTAALARRARAALVKRNVPTFGGSYAASIHPDVSVDFREETGADKWRDPHTYSSPEAIWNGEIGKFEGVRYIEAPRAKVFEDEGAGTTAADAYATLFIGAQAAVKAFPIPAGFGPNPRTVASPVTDHLRRFRAMGWYHLVGYAIFREESLERVETGSSLDEDYAA